MHITLINTALLAKKRPWPYWVLAVVILSSTMTHAKPLHKETLQDMSITVDSDKTMTVDQVFALIKDQTEYNYFYEAHLFEDFPEITIPKGTIRVKNLLAQSLAYKDYTVSVGSGNTLLINTSKPKTTVQQRQVTGQVLDEKGIPIVGAAVQIKGSLKGTATDFDGNFQITITKPDAVLVFSALGFATQEVMVGTQTSISITLKEALNTLGQVTINAGYYTVKDKERTGNISTVTAKAIETQPVINPLSALQGRMPGVYIEQQTGVAGGGFTVRIRGQNSITKGNDPLYIVDGVPFESNTLASLGTAIISNASPLNGINPSDIESIDVLKDADATAIYGSRGANGVVLITTKRGRVGKTAVSFDMRSGIGTVAHQMKLLNTAQYLEMRQEAFTNDNVTPTLSNAPDLLVWDQARYVDWQDELLGGTSYNQHAQVQISGGNQTTQFVMGGTLYKETTVFPGDFDYKRLSLNATMSHTSENKRFSGVLSMIYTKDHNGLPTEDLTYGALTLPPNIPDLLDDKGNLVFFSGLTNPLLPTKQEFEARNTTYVANAQVSYKLLETLKIKTSLGFNDMLRKERESRSKAAINPLSTSLPSSDFADANVNSWIIEPQLEYQQQLGDVYVQTLVGATFQQKDQNSKTLRGTGYINDALLEDVSAASAITVLDSDLSQYKYQAFYGRINVGYKDRYFLNVTGRRDGSSRFGEGNRFANFGAVGAAWLFSKEALFNSTQDVFSFGKIRASYGTTGNDQIGDYGYVDSYSPTTYSYQGVSGLYPTRLYNPDFGWERNRKLETALDLGFIKDRLRLSVAYYSNRSDNQLIGLPLPPSLGFSVIQSNLNATVANTGWEFSLETANINNGDVTWTSSINLTVPTTKLITYPNLESSVHANRYREGQSLFVVPTFRSTGVNPNTGLYEFEDVDMDGFISAPNDYQFLQETSPVFYGGIVNNLQYKNLSLDVHFQFAQQSGVNYLSTFFYAPGYMRNQPAVVLDRWQSPGDVATFQRFTRGNSQANAAYTNARTNGDQFYEDLYYIRLKNVNLSYQIPVDRLPFASARVYVQGQNLWTITDYKGLDPEGSPRSIPQLRILCLGFQCTF